MALIPATILTGFLGSGKTTLLKRVLSEAHGQKIAVIENEFGEENIDNDILVHDDGEQIIQMSNGCVCCTIREDLRATLQLLAAKRARACWTSSASSSRPPAWPTRARWRRPSSWTTRSPRATCSTPSSPWWTPSTPPSSSTTARRRAPGGLCRPDLHQQDRPGRRRRTGGAAAPPQAHEPAPQRVVHFGEVALARCSTCAAST
jgi:hypothetical protein